MKEVVRYLRDGWYGNEDRFEEGYDKYHKVTNCKKLFGESIKVLDAKFIPLCDGLEGRIGALTVNENHEHDVTGISIVTLIIDLTDAVGGDDENSGLE